MTRNLKGTHDFVFQQDARDAVTGNVRPSRRARDMCAEKKTKKTKSKSLRETDWRDRSRVSDGVYSSIIRPNPIKVRDRICHRK